MMEGVMNSLLKKQDLWVLTAPTAGVSLNKSFKFVSGPNP